MSGPKPGPSETGLFIKAETNIDAFSTEAATAKISAYFTVFNWFPNIVFSFPSQGQTANG